jgi:ketosteroid isomerase-like protein
LPSANVELVRSIYEAWERGDYGSVEWAHADIEWVFADGLMVGRWIGRGAIAEAWREFLDAWKELHTAADEYRELDDERVLVLYHFEARGRTSGMDLGDTRTEGANVFHVRDGKVVRAVFYIDRERALADLGLAADGGSGA